MGVNLIFRIAAVGILVSVICQVLKHSGRDEQAFLTSLAGLVLVLFWMIPYIYDLFEMCIRDRKNTTGRDRWWWPVIRREAAWLWPCAFTSGTMECLSPQAWYSCPHGLI